MQPHAEKYKWACAYGSILSRGCGEQRCLGANREEMAGANSRACKLVARETGNTPWKRDTY